MAVGRPEKGTTILCFLSWLQFQLEPHKPRTYKFKSLRSTHSRSFLRSVLEDSSGFLELPRVRYWAACDFSQATNVLLSYRLWPYLASVTIAYSRTGLFTIYSWWAEFLRLVPPFPLTPFNFCSGRCISLEYQWPQFSLSVFQSMFPVLRFLQLYFSTRQDKLLKALTIRQRQTIQGQCPLRMLG